MEEGRITIGRTTSNMEDDYISVEVILNDQIIKLKMSLEKYALVVTGMGQIRVEVERNKKL